MALLQMGADIWPTLLHLALALAITALILDLFLCTEIMAQVSALIFAIWLTVQVVDVADAHPFWYLLIFAVNLVVVELLYFFIWRAFVGKFIAGLLTRNASKEISEDMVGFRGPVEQSGGKYLLHHLEEYLAIDSSCTAGLSEGMMVEIVKVRNGYVVVKPVE